MGTVVLSPTVLLLFPAAGYLILVSWVQCNSESVSTTALPFPTAQRKLPTGTNQKNWVSVRLMLHLQS